MNNWLYRAIMVALWINILFGAYMVIAYESPPKMCLDGIVMVLDKDRDMYVQWGTLPTRCMPISKD